MPISSVGGCSLSEALIAHILDRIDSVVDPVFSLVDVPGLPEQEWRQLEKERILVRVAEPETVQVKPGKWLSVRKTDHGVFGCDESEDFPKLVPLSDSDLVQYRLNLDGFFRRVCERSTFRYARGEERHSFHPIGRKTLGESGVATVYVSLPNEDPESVAQRLRMLGDERGLKVVVFPRWPDVDAADCVADGLHIADLQPDLSIAWPSDVESPTRQQNDEEYAMIRKGGSWTIHYLGETIHPGSAVGLGYIARALQRSPDPLPMMEWERDVVFTDKDQRDSGGLEARLEPNQNLEVTDQKTLDQIDEAIDFLKAKIEDAAEIDDTETIEELQPKLDDLIKRKSGMSYGGRPKILGNEKLRKRLSKNLNTAYKAIERKDARIGKFLRKTVQLDGGKLIHKPHEGESWNVRF